MRQVDGAVVWSASDLNDFLACEQRTALGVAALLRDLPRPEPDPTLAVIARKGDEHERRVLRRLEESGVAVTRIADDDASVGAFHDAVAATRAAMERGDAAIYQAAFFDGLWSGRADLLLRVERPSALGPWSYDVADAKLAVREKASILVQLSLYARFAEAVQGMLPESVRALYGDGRETRYDPRRFVAYVDAARERFVARLPALDPERVPDRVRGCEGCAWSARCDARRRGADHLSLVANIRRTQIAKLAETGIPTVAALAGADSAARPRAMAPPTFAALRRQAALQVAQRVSGEPRYELLPPQERAGFALLPAPAEGDVYFDMEGDPLYEPGVGLEYLFGAYVDAPQPGYVEYWGETRDGEREAFQKFVDWLVRHRDGHPGAHVYHYAAYEKTALRKLAMRHGTREREVDELLRSEALVDLYAVVRGALAQSQESYSIKKLEPFYGFTRSADVRRGDDSIVAFEQYLLDRDPVRRSSIVSYNEEDCVSTRELHRWLLRLRDEARAAFGEIPYRPGRDPKEPTEKEIAEQARLDELQRALLAGTVPGDPRRLLAHLAGYHKREEKPVWWAFFDRCDRSGETTFVDDDAEALGGLEPAADVPDEAIPRSKKVLCTYRFPPQQHKIGPGAVRDPHRGLEGGEIDVVEVDEARLLVRLKRRPGEPHPRALAPSGPIRTPEQQQALRRLAESVLDGSVGTRYPACWEILARARPRIAGRLDGASVQPVPRVEGGAIEPEDVASLALRLDRSALVVQGPPGTGKTFTGARVVAALLAAGKRVGITSTGHQAIHNLLHAIEDAVAERGGTFRGVKKCNGAAAETRFVSARGVPFVENATANAPFEEYDLVAGTSWLLAREDLAALDVLVIDEAGQVALADALAMATNASSVVLLGDPLQLAQVSLGAHPEGSDASVLAHLLGDEPTVPEDRGVFLDRSFRMHPEICDFISTIVYRGRLHAAPDCARQRIDARAFAGAGLRYVPVAHDGNVHRSEEEAEVVAELLGELLGGTFTARDGTTREIGLRDVLIVSPYNAQVRLLRERLGGRFGDGARVGTVDKFQGQEAPVVVFSLAASSAEEAPRGADFLYEPNRFNVALSRGRALSVLVGSPRLLETSCASVEQLAAVAAFCAFAAAAAPRPVAV